MHSLRSDDGSELKIKEGVVLGPEGRPIGGPSFVFQRMPWVWTGALIFAVPLVVITGFALLGGIFALGTVYWAFKTLTRS